MEIPEYGCLMRPMGSEADTSSLFNLELCSLLSAILLHCVFEVLEIRSQVPQDAQASKRPPKGGSPEQLWSPSF